MNLIDVRIVDVLFRHLSCSHIQILHHPVGRPVLVYAQFEAVVFLHTAVAHENEGTVVLRDLLVMRELIDEARLAPAFVPGLRDGCLVEVNTLLQGRHVEMVAPGVHIVIGTDAEAPTLSYGR